MALYELIKCQMNDNAEECDLFSGKWIQDASGPAYSNTSCSFISYPQDCLTNGRPDTGYLYWRWKPYDCNLSLMDARKFLNIMRNKSLAFIGDSICRNQTESLLCLLSKVLFMLAAKCYKFQHYVWYYIIEKNLMAKFLGLSHGVT